MEFTFKEARLIVSALERSVMWERINKDGCSNEYQDLINKFEKQIIGKVKKVKK